jgi:hypothetical protein
MSSKPPEWSPTAELREIGLMLFSAGPVGHGTTSPGRGTNMIDSRTKVTVRGRAKKRPAAKAGGREKSSAKRCARSVLATLVI